MKGSLAAGAALVALVSGAPAFAQGAETDQDGIVVTGRAKQLYRVEDVQAGKLPTDPLVSSLTIQVIDQDLIADQGARDAQDLYRNFSGVSFFSYAGVTARGFRQEEIFFDGLRGDPYAGFSVPQLFNVEQVEFLKGPAGMLYGPGAPGGLLNYVTKRPDKEFSAEASAVLGTEARYGASGEITGALPGPGDPAGRLGLFYEDRNTARRNAGNEALILDGGLALDVGSGVLTLQATHYEQDLAANRLRGVPVDAAGRFLADRRWNHNEPTDFLRLRSDVLQARFEGDFGDNLTLDMGLRWNDAEERQRYHEPSGLRDSNGDGVLDQTQREFRDQTRPSESLSFAANGVWSKDFGALDNRVLIGADWYEEEGALIYYRSRGNYTVRAGFPAPLSLTNPVYGLIDPSTYTLSLVPNSPTRQERSGAYLLEEATIGPWIATLGVRFDQYNDDNGATTIEDERATWRAGLVYRATGEISLFAQWAESFEPQDLGDQDPLAGGPFDPTEGTIVEGGVRTALFGGRIQANLSAYEIVRTNILQSDPRGDVDGDGVDDLTAFGEVTSKGAELDLAADITADWVLTANYAYNDTRVTANNGASALTNSVGDRFANAPEHTFGFWTRYQVRPLGLAVALGGDYVDVRQSLDGQKVRPYTVFDASLIYETGHWRAMLRVDNLSDETYAASGFLARSGHFPGDPRSVFLELSRMW